MVRLSARVVTQTRLLPNPFASATTPAVRKDAPSLRFAASSPSLVSSSHSISMSSITSEGAAEAAEAAGLVNLIALEGVV